MRIKELEDVLVLVDELQEKQQWICAKLLLHVVDDWEAFTAEAVTREEWYRIRDQRRARNTELMPKKLEATRCGRCRGGRCEGDAAERDGTAWSSSAEGRVCIRTQSSSG